MSDLTPAERARRREQRDATEARRNAERAAELEKRGEMVTYRNADGSYVGGEYAHVGELDFWNDCDEPVKVIGEKWVLVGRWEIEVPESAVELRDALLAEAAEEEAEADR